MKQDIGEVLINFINDNQSRDWNSTFKAVFILLGLFWLGICLWVYNDARSRYNKRIVSILITLFILVFNIPALIIYVILRPEHTREEISLIAHATSGGSFGQSLPFDIEKDLLSSGKSFKMQFAINFTPSVIDGQPKLNFNVESVNGLPLNEEFSQRKTLAENVEVISKDEKKDLEQKIPEENILKEEQLKLSEQLIKQNPENSLDSKKSRKELIKEKLKDIFSKVTIYQRKIIQKIKESKIRKDKKNKEKTQLSLLDKAKIIRVKIFPTKAVNPTEIILPESKIPSDYPEKLAKSKKKKKNRNRRR